MFLTVSFAPRAYLTHIFDVIGPKVFLGKLTAFPTIRHTDLASDGTDRTELDAMGRDGMGTGRDGTTYN